MLPTPISPSLSSRGVIAELPSCGAGFPLAPSATIWPGFGSIRGPAGDALCAARFLAGYRANVSSPYFVRVQANSRSRAARVGGSSFGARGDQRGGKALLRQRRGAPAGPASELHRRLLPVQTRLREERQLEGARQPGPVRHEARA